MLRGKLKNIQLLAVAAFLFMGAASSNAITYEVTDSVYNCSGSPHGLWTNKDFSGSKCANFFSISGLLKVDTSSENAEDWFAVLDAKATNPDGKDADINITFSDWTGEHKYKRENGAAYNPDNVDFFQDILGTIVIDDVTYDIDGFAGGYAFQYGMGANAKNPGVFGASAWVQSCTDDNYIPGTQCMNSHHWDLNLNLSQVPLPGALILFGSALFGMGAIRRKRK